MGRAKRKKNNLIPVLFFTTLLLALGLIVKQQLVPYLRQASQSDNSFTAQIAGNTAKALNGLQLKSITFTSPTPMIPTPTTSSIINTPTNSNAVCHIDDNFCHNINQITCCGDATIYCSGGKCRGGFRDPNNPNICHAPGLTIGTDAICHEACGNKDGWTCWGKPVIYLYPKTDMHVNVSVQTSGEIVISDPKYPEGGWKNVLAKPSGELIYNDRTYSELFYESEVKNSWQPKKGIIIASNQLGTQLKSIVYQLGLNLSESQEFTEFWIPRLKNLNSNYILFSIVDKNIKQANDNVIINPQPDTRIEFIAYFKPLKFPVVIEPLEILARPARVGFTEVEWGGMIDSANTALSLY
jgi:hypothetical protein